MLKTFVIAFSLFLAVLSRADGQVADMYRADMGADELVLKTPDGKPVLTYRHSVKQPPAGVDPAYARSGYVHPLRTLSGKTLTNIQPADHYHHYGLWNPWTRVEYRGKTYDMWNLGDKSGTVRFVRFGALFADARKAGFEAVHDHIVFDEGKETRTVESSRGGVRRDRE